MAAVPRGTATAAEATGSTAERDLDAALAAVITGAGRRGASLESLWHGAIAVDPDLATAVDRRARLLAALRRLVAIGVARPLPSRRDALEASAVPALPRVVRTVGPPARQRPERPTLPAGLRPELAGARDLERPRADEIATLVAVNDFLRDLDPSRPFVPVRERSLEIFGDEKRLDALVSQRLFTSGVLTLDLLRCYVVHPPFVYQRVSDEPTALVIENHHTYDSARRVLERAPRGIGVVAYGAGRAFCASVTYLADLQPRIERAYYFGDLDAAGLSIAAGADMAGRAAGTPPVLPATGLYRALLASPHHRPGTVIDDFIAEGLLAWLPAELRAAATDMLESGQWLPQEAVGIEVLTALTDWL
jgi:Wadjet anti plasmid transformation system JetA-like protein